MAELMIINWVSNNVSGYCMYVQYRVGQKLSLFIIAITLSIAN